MKAFPSFIPQLTPGRFHGRIFARNYTTCRHGWYGVCAALSLILTLSLILSLTLSLSLSPSGLMNRLRCDFGVSGNPPFPDRPRQLWTQ